jgi:hypothetical protein
MNTENA